MGSLLLKDFVLWSPAHPLSGTRVDISVKEGIIDEVRPAQADVSEALAADGSTSAPMETLHGRGTLHVMPGFIDSHVHFFDGGRRLAGLDLSACATPAALVAAIRGHVRRTILQPPPPTSDTDRHGPAAAVDGGPFTEAEQARLAALAKGGSSGGGVPWVSGYRWSDVTLGAVPDRRLLDEACAALPVAIVRFDCHSLVANSAALALAGIDDIGPAEVPGGIIVRGPPTAASQRHDINGIGAPTGLLKENAMRLVNTARKASLRVTDADLDAAYDAAAGHLLAHGVTTCFSMTSLDFSNVSEIEYLLRREERGLPMRVRIRSVVLGHEVPWLESLRAQRGGLSSAPHDWGTDFLRLGAVKIFSDGSLGSRTAAMHEPYGDAPAGGDHDDGCPCGTLLMPVPDLHAAMRDCHAHKLQCCVHAIGDRATSTVLEGMRLGTDSDDGDGTGTAAALRSRIEHCQHMASHAAIAAMGAAGLTASVQPCHLLFDGDHLAMRLGPQRAALAYPLRSMAAAGVPVVMGTDWMVAPLCPLQNIIAAVHRTPLPSRLNPNPAPWSPCEAFTVEEALVAYTAGAAHAMFAEGRIGRIFKGFAADLTVLSTSPQKALAAPPTPAGRPSCPIHVVATIVAGRAGFVSHPFASH